MHQVKTQSSRREPQAEMTSSKTSIRRKTVGKERYHENAKTNTKELGIFSILLYEILPYKFRKLDNSSI